MTTGAAIRNASASETETSRSGRDPGRPSRNRTFTGKIKALFKGAAKTVAKRAADEPRPKTKRRKGDTGRAFGRAAKSTFRRRIRLPDAAYAAALYLADTLDWLNLWHHDDALSQEPQETFDSTNHLSLDL